MKRIKWGTDDTWGGLYKSDDSTEGRKGEGNRERGTNINSIKANQVL